VLKHAPQCPESTTPMEQVFHDAGLPADAYSTDVTNGGS
jgi:succinate-semialdehyde dehydrogenase/glutarate-semialdehyde dehydrogenase